MEGHTGEEHLIRVKLVDRLKGKYGSGILAFRWELNSLEDKEHIVNLGGDERGYLAIMNLILT